MDELAKINPKSSSDNDAFVKSLHNMVSLQMKHLGYALRYHNEQHQNNMIILQDVMRDVVNFKTNRPSKRSAAQNHFLSLLTLGTTIERHKTSARGDGNFAKVSMWTSLQIPEAFDIPQGVLLCMGYSM